MTDISDKDRIFRVWATTPRLEDGQEESLVIEVKAGDDADEICGDICHDLIANLVESGWEEK